MIALCFFQSPLKQVQLFVQFFVLELKAVDESLALRGYYIFFSLKSTDFLFLASLKCPLQVSLLDLKVLLQCLMEGLNNVIRILSLDRIDHRLEAFQFVPKIADLSALCISYLEIGALDSDT